MEERQGFEQLIPEILENVRVEDNTHEVYMMFLELDSDLLIEGENPYKDTYDKLIEMGEEEIANKYLSAYI